MILTMHGLTTMHCNIKTEIRIANEAKYQALEIIADKLLRYLDTGFTAEELLPVFKSYGIIPACINALKDIESMDRKEHNKLLWECERLCAAAEILGCRVLQLVAFNGLSGRPWKEIRELTAKNIAKLADIADEHKVKLQLEPIAFSPMNSLSKSLEVIEAADRENVGMVIDFWHLWAGGGTTASEVAKLDRSMIYGVHFCDGVKPKDERWDEAALRGYLVGDGDINVEEWVVAVKATGFDGVWSAELYSPKHWEWDLMEIAVESKKRMMKYLNII
ncbi:MAG: sugar phosphate isomerase/epimerase [Actinobacteria bacterium]|nr:sugar phosphate isomerase/epimerase [Actinomycetota bacterium]